MSWERTKASTMTLSPAPSMLRWLLVGVLAIIFGAILFTLHATGTVAVLAEYNIWWVSLIPASCWLLLFCIRGWLRGREVDEYTFLQQEADRTQKQWEAWAARYVTVIKSCAFLPESITARSLYAELPHQYRLSVRVDYLPQGSSPVQSRLGLLLAGVLDAIQGLPATLPLKVTLVTDDRQDALADTFSEAWKELLPERTLPAEITVTQMCSMHMLEDRLKQPDLTVELLLVMQLRGGTAYSDGLAALLLTSDDVAQKYQLPHVARLLRPMALDMKQFTSQLTLFLETQTVARQTSRVFCDSVGWHDYFVELLTTGAAHHTRWKPEEIGVLERWCGIPGPGGGWLLAALLADVVNISNTPVLGLFTSATDHFVSTITPGSENQ